MHYVVIDFSQQVLQVEDKKVALLFPNSCCVPIRLILVEGETIPPMSEKLAMAILNEGPIRYKEGIVEPLIDIVKRILVTKSLGKYSYAGHNSYSHCKHWARVCQDLKMEIFLCTRLLEIIKIRRVMNFLHCCKSFLLRKEAPN